MAHMRHSVTQTLTNNQHTLTLSASSFISKCSCKTINGAAVSHLSGNKQCSTSMWKITKQEANNTHCTTLSIVNATIYHCSNNPFGRSADVSAPKGILVKKKLSTDYCMDKNEQVTNVTKISKRGQKTQC